MTRLEDLASQALKVKSVFFELRDFNERQEFIKALLTELDKQKLDYRVETRFFQELWPTGIITHVITEITVPKLNKEIRVFDGKVEVLTKEVATQ